MKAFIFSVVLTKHDKSAKKLVQVCVWADNVNHTHAFRTYIESHFPGSDWCASGVPRITELPCDDSKKWGDYEVLLILDLIGDNAFRIDPIAVFA